MPDVMMRLGAFKFEINTAVYQSLRQNWEFHWQAQARIGINPARQFVGYDRSIELAGVMYPGQFGSRKHIETMTEMAGKGLPLLMVASTGVPLGYWCITKINASNSVFLSNGEPRKIDFSVSLEYYGEKYGESA